MCPEPDLVAREIQIPEDDVGAGQRRVTAQRHLRHRGEPADVKIMLIAGVARHEEGRFREIVLRRDRLHQIVGDPCVERTDSRRVAKKHRIREGIDLINR